MRISLVLYAAAAIAIVGCRRQEASAPYISQTIGEGDVRFITDAYNLTMFDRDEGMLAPARTRNPAVLDMASYLARTGTHYQDLIRPAAARKGIEPPQVLDPKLQGRLGHTQQLDGVAFDRAYVDDQIYSHQTIFDRASELVGTTQDPDLNRLLRESLGQLQRSLERLHVLQDRMVTE